ncbi:MAG: TolC family protein [Ruminococcaceae bacterium]|nr:TolC family protein [Oscillospiraceae bacterium]
MKRNKVALLLAVAMLASLCAVSAMAGEETKPPLLIAPAPSGLSPEVESVVQETIITPDAVGTVSFGNVGSRMRQNNLTILTLQQSVDSLEDIDYEEMKEDVRENLNLMAAQSWGMHQMSAYEPIGSMMALSSVEQQYSSLKQTFEDLKDGSLQEENAGLIRQLQNGQDQLVLAGETTFIALKGLEVKEAGLERQLGALNRTVEEMTLRHEMGQISELQLSQIKTGQTSLASGLETLRMNIATYKTQLELLLGAELTGEIVLGQLPDVTGEQLDQMDLEKDLASAMEQSYELYAAAETLADAKETYEDAADKYNENEKKAEFRNAKRVWQSAQYTYNDTVQNYELRFRTLYAQVGDYRQALEAAKTSLAFQQQNLAAAELKCQQGTISQNALLDAKDSVREAEETVQTAANNLFSAYNSYRWAVDYGILN